MNKGLLIAGLLSAGPPIPAEEMGLSGHWGGLRDNLSGRGFDLHAGYIGEVMGNISGGLRTGAVYEGLLELGIQVDFERAGLWSNGVFYVSALWPHGRGPTEHLVGDLLGVSNIEAWESLRLYELWYEHSFLEDRLSVRFGQLLADTDFAYTGPGSLFLNAAFGWPAFISANTLNTGPAYYVAAPGVRLRADPEDWLFFQAGIYDGDPFDDPEGDPRRTESGNHVQLGSEQGFLSMGEVGIRIPRSEDAGSLPGEYKLGGWFHSGDFESNLYDSSSEPYLLSGAAPRSHGENYGVYITAEQMVWRESPESAEGLSVFSRAGFSRADRNLFSFVCDGGFTYEGLFPGRENDIAGIGVVYARISEDIRRRERLERNLTGEDAPVSDHELVLEASYSIQVGQWLSIQPDFQWIHHPGGSSAIPDAFVLGLRTTIIF